MTPQMADTKTLPLHFSTPALDLYESINSFIEFDHYYVENEKSQRSKAEIELLKRNAGKLESVSDNDPTSLTLWQRKIRDEVVKSDRLKNKTRSLNKPEKLDAPLRICKKRKLEYMSHVDDKVYNRRKTQKKYHIRKQLLVKGIPAEIIDATFKSLDFKAISLNDMRKVVHEAIAKNLSAKNMDQPVFEQEAENGDGDVEIEEEADFAFHTQVEEESILPDEPAFEYTETKEQVEDMILPDEPEFAFVDITNSEGQWKNQKIDDPLESKMEKRSRLRRMARKRACTDTNVEIVDLEAESSD